MTTKLHELINEIFRKYEESPKKYCSVIWRDNKKEIKIDDIRLTIENAIIVFQDGTTRKVVDASNNDNRFMLLCRPKKHMTFVITDNSQYECCKLFQLNEKHTDKENNNTEDFICIIETTNKSTFVFAYINGLYFLQTFDSEYPVTLLNVFDVLMKPLNEIRKECDADVEKEEKNENGLLEVLGG